MLEDIKVNPKSHEKQYAGLFPFVNKPSRYVGNEWNSIKKTEAQKQEAVGVCLCFPDLYETGFANTGIEILYQILNRRADAYAERAYCPDTDFAALLRQKKVPFSSLETYKPLKNFQVIGFGLPYELCYTNILEMLDLSGIPLRSDQRNENWPLIIAGGPCSVNPEPLADFLDGIVIGDGEEVIGAVIETVKNHRKSRAGKKDLLLELSQIRGLYIPSLYDVLYNPDQTIAQVLPRFPNVPAKVPYSRFDLAHNLEERYGFPVSPVVPFVQTVHDRLNVEIQRGCPWRCRFCQAGFTYRPYRERSKEDLVGMIEKGLKNTGYDAVTLAGLSAADHTEIIPLLQTVAEKFSASRVSVGLPSTRSDRFTLALAEILNTVRRQSITFAPEAGTERMRRVIRKELEESEIRHTLKMAHQHGWKNVKLYFMYALPTETQEDLEAINQLVRASRKENPGLSFTLTLSPFVPKPHTPYQWHAQDRLELLREKLGFLRKILPTQIRAHGLEQIEVEGLLSRGDRRCSALLEYVWKKGATFDEWGERFRYELWQEGFAATGLHPEFYSYRTRGQNEILPWDHLEGGPEKRALWNDYQTALRQATEPLPVPHHKPRPDVPAPRKIQLTHERPVQKIRFKMSRAGEVRFLSHLEQIEMVRRALRRAQLPLAYTAGFHPQLKCSFGPAISVGYESQCEYFDLELTRRMDLEPVRDLVSRQMPQGFALGKVSRIPLFFPSLESLINRAEYDVKVPGKFMSDSQGDPLKIATDLKNFLDRPNLVIEKKKSLEGKPALQIQLKPVILQIEWVPSTPALSQPGDEPLDFAGFFHMVLKFGPGKNVKPEKIVGLFLNLKEEETLELVVVRRAFYIEKPDQTVIEP